MSATRARSERLSGSREGRCPSPAEYWDAEGNRKKCHKSELRELQRPVGAFICGECGRALTPIRKPARTRTPYFIAAGVALLLVVGAGGYVLIRPGGGPTAACTSTVPGSNADRIRAIIDANPPTPDLLRLASQCADVNVVDEIPLLRAAVDRGDANAAVLLGQIYDPIDVDGRKHQLSPAVPHNAATFYLTARRNGDPLACARLTALLAWARQHALEGDAAARQVQSVLDGAPAC